MKSFTPYSSHHLRSINQLRDKPTQRHVLFRTHTGEGHLSAPAIWFAISEARLTSVCFTMAVAFENVCTLNPFYIIASIFIERRGMVCVCFCHFSWPSRQIWCWQKQRERCVGAPVLRSDFVPCDSVAWLFATHHGSYWNERSAAAAPRLAGT